MDSEELKSAGLIESYGSFEYLYKIENEVKTGKVSASNYGQSLRMTKEEKDISFLNNYFIFKKVRNISEQDAKAVLISKTQKDLLSEEKSSLKEDFKIKEQVTIDVPIVPDTTLKSSIIEKVIQTVPDKLKKSTK